MSDAIAELSIHELTAELAEWQRVAAQRQEHSDRTAKRLDEAIGLIVEVGGALDGAIAGHLLPGVVGKNARQLSLRSRKWLATNAGVAAPAAEAMTATIAAAYGAGNDAAQARIAELEALLADKELVLEKYAEQKDRLAQVEVLGGQALALWTNWCTHDITSDDDHWAEFTNAVHELLAGRPVPSRFLGPVPAQLDGAVPRVRTRIQELELRLGNADDQEQETQDWNAELQHARFQARRLLELAREMLPKDRRPGSLWRAIGGWLTRNPATPAPAADESQREPDRCDRCETVVDGDAAATSDICWDCRRALESRVSFLEELVDEFIDGLDGQPSGGDNLDGLLHEYGYRPTVTAGPIVEIPDELAEALVESGQCVDVTAAPSAGTPEEREWFCPECGPSGPEMPTVDEEGTCLLCGATCCRMSQLRSLFAANGLHVVDAKRWALLEECAALKISTDAVGPVSMNGKPQIYSSTSALAAAEWACRAAKEGT